MIAGLRARLARPRLTDAVVVAAAALLSLKLIALLTAPPTADAPASDLPAFARVLAHARSNYAAPDPATTGSVAASPAPEARAAAPPDAAPVQRVAGSDPASSSERALLERLGERREELQQRGRDLDTRGRLLENAEKRLEGRLQELRTLEERGEAAAARRGDTETGALKNLVTMYESMKPKEAARVFERLPQDVLVPVVTGMNPRKMAEVLAAMSPESAERLTVALASRARSLGGGPAEARPAALPPGELPSIEAPAPRPRQPAP